MNELRVIICLKILHMVVRMMPQPLRSEIAGALRQWAAARMRGEKGK
jgi:hypothetical protein